MSHNSFQKGFVTLHVQRFRVPKAMLFAKEAVRLDGIGILSAARRVREQQ
jgi:hypothetical protein